MAEAHLVFEDTETGYIVTLEVEPHRAGTTSSMVKRTPAEQAAQAVFDLITRLPREQSHD